MASQQALAEGLRNPTGSKCGAQISLTRDTSGLLQFLSPAPRVSLIETFLTYKHLDTTNVCLQLLISAPRKSLGCALLHSTQLCWIPPAAMADVETSERAWRGCVDRGGSLTMLWSSFLLGGIWKRPWACLTVKKTLFFSSKEPRDNCDCVQHLQVWMVNSICGFSFRIPFGWSSLVKCPQSSGMLRYWLALPSSTDFSRDTEEGKACNACPQLNFQPGNCRMHLQIVIQ